MTPDDQARIAAMLTHELAASLGLLRDHLARAELPRPEAEAWTRVELFTMTSANYLNQLDPIMMRLIHNDIATTLATWLPKTHPKELT